MNKDLHPVTFVLFYCYNIYFLFIHTYLDNIVTIEWLAAKKVLISDDLLLKICRFQKQVSLHRHRVLTLSFELCVSDNF